MPPSGYEEFQQHFEQAGTREYKKFSAMPLESLLDRVREKIFTDYYQLWPAIASKASLQQAGWILFDVLNSDIDYLNRYHCAAALIKIGRSVLAGWQPVMLSSDKIHPLAENLKKVEVLIESAIGKRA